MDCSSPPVWPPRPAWPSPRPRSHDLHSCGEPRPVHFGLLSVGESGADASDVQRAGRIDHPERRRWRRAAARRPLAPVPVPREPPPASRGRAASSRPVARDAGLREHRRCRLETERRVRHRQHVVDALEVRNCTVAVMPGSSLPSGFLTDHDRGVVHHVVLRRRLQAHLLHRSGEVLVRIRLHGELHRLPVLDLTDVALVDRGEDLHLATDRWRSGRAAAPRGSRRRFDRRRRCARRSRRRWARRCSCTRDSAWRGRARSAPTSPPPDRRRSSTGSVPNSIAVMTLAS